MSDIKTDNKVQTKEVPTKGVHKEHIFILIDKPTPKAYYNNPIKQKNYIIFPFTLAGSSYFLYKYDTKNCTFDRAGKLFKLNNEYKICFPYTTHTGIYYAYYDIKTSSYTIDEKVYKLNDDVIETETKTKEPVETKNVIETKNKEIKKNKKTTEFKETVKKLSLVPALADALVCTDASADDELATYLNDYNQNTIEYLDSIDATRKMEIASCMLISEIREIKKVNSSLSYTDIFYSILNRYNKYEGMTFMHKIMKECLANRVARGGNKMVSEFVSEYNKNIGRVANEKLLQEQFRNEIINFDFMVQKVRNVFKTKNDPIITA